MTIVRGRAAEKLLRQLDGAGSAVPPGSGDAESSSDDPADRELRVQHLLARVTGQYKHGNERRGKTRDR